MISSYFNRREPAGTASRAIRFAFMDRELISEHIDALRVEALEARRLAERLSDAQSILDLHQYAAQLEDEAARLGSRGNRSPEPQKRPVEHAMTGCQR